MSHARTCLSPKLTQNQTFFVEGERGCSPESAKHRTSLGKSTDVLPQNYGCFHRKSPMFLFSGKRAEQACSKLARQAIEEDEVKGSRRRPLFGLSQSTVSSPHFQMLKKICRTATTRNVDRKRIHTQTAQEKTVRRGIGSALILPRQCHCRGKFLQKAEGHSWHF